MLNIPESVKALFKQDGINKNFRVHFPNGELSDITNADIVQESVRFQESVCSHDVFKFGLTEASVIEFESVGVANMYGMTIQCFNEIDCSSLSAAEIADIEAGTWDGTWDGTNKVFAVPYGVFRVESCPRDHQAMAHRKVTAYTKDADVSIPFWENAKLTYTFNKFAPYTPNAKRLALSLLGQNSETALISAGLTKTAYTTHGTNTHSETITLPLNGGGTVTRYLKTYSDTYTLQGDTLFNVSIGNGNTFLAQICDYFEQFDLDYEQIGSLEEFFAATLGRRQAVTPTLGYPYSGAGAFRTRTLSENLPCFYPYLNNKATMNGRLFSITRIEIRTTAGQSTPDTTILPIGEDPLTVYEYSDSNPLNITLSFAETGRTSRQYVTFADAYDPREITNGLLELMAWFSVNLRNGGKAVSRISNSSPVAFTPGDYSQMWWDEYNVEPIGTIRYSFTDEAGEEQIVDYKFGDGASIYDMTDNAVLKAMSGASPDVIESLLDTYFVPHLAAVNFVPIDLAARGLPYIEAGDALSVTAQDGTVCNSYALRREMNGVQVLTDQIDSQSGLIIDSEEGA